MSQIESVTIIEESPPRTIVVELGVEGDQGSTGPTGPEPTPVSFQLTGSSSFTATHSFAWLPQVWFIDADGELIVYTVEYPDATHVFVEFPTPFTGTMFVR